MSETNGRCGGALEEEPPGPFLVMQTMSPGQYLIVHFALHYEKSNFLSSQAGYSPYLVLTWDELGEHLRSMHSKPENETKNPDLPFFAKVGLSQCFANVMLCYPGDCVLVQRVSLLQPLPPKYFFLDNRWVCKSQEGWCVC